MPGKPTPTPTPRQLAAENEELRDRLNEAEETLRAIRGGEADALVLSGANGDYVLTLKGGQEPYRVMVEAMGEGAVTLALDGTILYSNRRFADWVKMPLGNIVGLPVQGMLAEQDWQGFDAMLVQGAEGDIREMQALQAADGTQTPALFSMCPLPQSEGKVISVVIADLSEVGAAAEARSRLALIVESSDDAIVSITLDGVVESWNRAAENLYGYTAREAIGMHINDLIVPPERVSEMMHELEAICLGKRTLLEDTVRLRKDGTELDVSIKASPILDASDKVIGASINSRDITERKQAEADLHESELAYRTLAQNLPGMVYRAYVREAGRVQFYNAMPVLLTGYTEDELTTGTVCSIEPLILDVDRPGVTAEVRRAISGNRAFAVEYRIKRKDGSIRWMAEHGMPVYGTDGEPVFIEGVIFDTTKNKQAETELKLFRDLLDDSSDIVLVADPDTARFIDVNLRASISLGYSRDELLRMKVMDIDTADPSKSAWGHTVNVVKNAGTTLLEVNFRRKDGGTFPVEISGKYLSREGNSYIVAIARDITERKTAELVLKNSEHQLSEALSIAKIGYWEYEFSTDEFIFNDQYYSLHKTTVEEVGGYRMTSAEFASRYTHPEDAYKVGHYIHLAIETSDPNYSVLTEVRLINEEGEIFWVEVRFTVQKDQQGKTVRLIGISQDITARKQAELELHWKTAFFEALVKTSADGVLVVDDQHMKILQNQRLIDLLGIPEDIAEDPDDNPQLQFVTNQVVDAKQFADKVRYLYEYPEEESHDDVVLKNGSYLERYSAPVHDDNGHYYGRIWSFHDVTQRKQAELKLHESERRFTDLLGNVELLSVILDREARITYCNDYLLRLTGWQRKEIIGESWWELFVPSEIQDLDGGFFTSLLDNKPEAMHHENEILTRSGERRMIRWNNSVLRSVTGEVIGTASIGEDITERKNAEASIKYLNRVLSVLSGINTLIVHAKDLDELFSEACKIATEAGGFRMAMIVIVEQDTMLPVSITSAGKDDELLTEIKNTLSSGNGLQKPLVSQVISEKQAVISNDTQNDSRLLFGKHYAAAGVSSMTVLPLIISDEAVGVLALYASEIEFFQNDEMKLLTELASDIAYAIDHIEKQERLNYLAYYDELTGLANHSLFSDRAAQYIHSAISGEHKLAIGLIDLDRFKNINDSLGRPTGDALLKQVAEWLTHKMGDANLLARVDADHFAILLPEVTSDGNLAKLIENLMAAFLEHRFHVNETELRIGIKVGIALFPDDGDNADILFRNAEAALKKAKSGGDRYLFYTQKMTAAVADKVALENQLREAIDNEEFVLHYQPKVNLVSGKVTGAEALIRWNDPRTGLVPPGMFIPILEETGLIYEVGRWALRKAIEDNLRWRAAGLTVVRIAVNVSPLQLRSTNFMNEIRQEISLDAHAAEGLELEITESLIMEDVKHSITSLQAIRALGITIAIDDFGTGFSSLSYMAKLPVDTLKIDRAFVIEMDTSEGLALVSTIIILAHALKLKVVAEGVETEKQSRQLLSLNCDEMQGFLFSKPVPADIFESRFLAPPAPDDKQY